MPKGTQRDLPVEKELTVNLHKRLHGIGFKKRAPRAIREIKREAEKEMKTKDVRVDTELNKFVWSKGIRNVPRRVRIKMVRQRNDDEEASEKMFTIVKHVDVDTFKGVVPGKTNVAVDEEDSD